MAANHYVRAGATGNGSGSDWTNAAQALPASLVRGDTYYVAAGNYSGHAFNDAGGSASAVITVKAATVADHGTPTGWSDPFAGTAHFSGSVGAAIFEFRQPYYVIDGQARNPDWISGYGFHLNNTGCVTNNTVVSLGASNITVRYTDVEGSHNRSGSCTDESFQDFANGNITVEYNYIHDNGEANFKLRGSSTSSGSNGLVNFTVQNNYIARNFSQGGSGVHSESMSVSDGVQNLVVRWNRFVDIDGTSVIATASGSCYAGCPNFNRGNGPWYIYGNQWHFSATPPSSCAVGGFVSFFDVGFTGNVYVYSNTIGFINSTVCPQGSGGQAGVWIQAGPVAMQTVVVQNNIWFNSDVAPPISFGGCGSPCSGTRIWDHNAYFGTTGSIGDPDPNKQVSSSNPFLNATGRDFHLATDTSPWLVLASPYNTDLDGNQRISSRGAFQFGAAASPTAPAGLAAIVH
jgi:hypothetical protein